jgi:hypothetical protein
MARATIGKELQCIAKNEVGLLGRIVLALAQKDVFIQHLLAYTINGTGALKLVTKDQDFEKAKEAISYFIPQIEQKDVLIVEFENKVGTLASVAKILGSNSVGIKSVYGTSADGFKIVGIFSTEDDQRACELINSEA